MGDAIGVIADSAACTWAREALEEATRPIRHAAAVATTTAAMMTEFVRGDVREAVNDQYAAQQALTDAVAGLTADTNWAIPLVDNMWHGKIHQMHALIMKLTDEINVQTNRCRHENK